MQLARVAVLSWLAGCTSNAAHRIQYIPKAQTPEEDAPDKPPAPTDLIITGQPGFNAIQVVVPAFELFDTVQVYASTTNNRTNALKIADGRQSAFIHESAGFMLNYYWCRTIKKALGVGFDVVSEWFPTSSTAGVTAGTTDSGKDLVPDNHFALKTDNTYWYTFAGTGGAAPIIQLTGGTIAGLAQIVGSGHNKALVSRKRPAIQSVVGEMWTVAMRWRRTATITGSAAVFIAGIMKHAESPDSPTFNPYTGGIGQMAAGGVRMTLAEMNARTLDEWQEDSGLALIVPNSGYVGGDFPFISLVVLMDSVFTGGTVQIDYINATSGSNGRPRQRIYTSGATLSLTDLMMLVIYNSASGDTLTLPTPTDDMLGARIFFEQRGAGLLTIGAPGFGSLLSPPNTTGNRALSGRYARAEAECMGSTVNAWVLSGSLA